MGIFGGSSNASNNLSNVINFNPAFNLGDDNTSDTSSQLDQKASSSAELRDELTASAGFGGDGGSVQRSSGDEKRSGGFFGGGSTSSNGLKLDNQTILIGVGVLSFSIVASSFLKSKK